MSAKAKETSVRYRVLAEVDDWMTAQEIARFLARDINAVKGVLQMLVEQNKMSIRGGHSAAEYKTNQILQRDMAAMPWVDTQWIHTLEVMQRGWV